ncbi:hypothetical protein C2R22_14475 [Salinigranum rubrum]|uniref:SHOCT domain-containing protein n=1 Tax=Salinigranum rubrum TaxID=755307 RepID=A0A2I8VL90_9EURY|nr:SHOCT domain-containing protein [Salinigranum rubrum]AUV82700.1 hypothetical protein C2R22_14475 [Salinigranum rubrum]
MRTSLSSTDGWNGYHANGGRTATASGLTTLVILAVAFGAMALGVPYFWVVFPVGFGGVLPLVVAHSLRTERDSDGSDGPGRSLSDAPAETTDADGSTDEALRTLRTRYARGELTDEAFEARLERLLETETVADATNRTRPPSDSASEEGDHSG